MRSINAPIAAIVEKVSDLKTIAAAVRRLEKKIKDGEEAAAEQGRYLIEARAQFGKRGDGFIEWAEKETGLRRTAVNDRMKSAGYKGSGSGRKSEHEDADHSAERNDSTHGATGSSQSDQIENAILKLHDKLIATAEKWPQPYRRLMATELRNLAKIIEVME